MKLPKIADDKMVVVIPDLHGSYDLFARAEQKIARLIQANPGRDIEVIYLGDTINKGPDSALVLQLIQELKVKYNQENIKITYIRGNHEGSYTKGFNKDVPITENYIRNGYDMLTKKGFDLTVRSYMEIYNFNFDDLDITQPPKLSEGYTQVEMDAAVAWHEKFRTIFLEKIPQQDIDLIRNEMQLYYKIPTEDGIDLLFVHGGFDPSKPFHQQRENEGILTWRRYPVDIAALYKISQHKLRYVPIYFKKNT